MTGWALIFDLKINFGVPVQSAHSLCNWPTIHNSMSNIFPKFSLVTFLMLMICLMSIKQKLYQEKIFQPQSMQNAILGDDKIYWKKATVKNSGILSGLNIQLEQSKKLVWGCGNSCTVFPVNNNEPMAQWWRSIAVSQATWVQFKQGAETMCSLLAVLHCTEPVSGLTHVLYLAALSWNLLLQSSEWQACADNSLSLSINIWPPHFWLTWSRVRGIVSALSACM